VNATFTRRTTAALTATIVTLGACGSDENISSSTAASAETTADTTDHERATVTIGGVDFGFTNVPASISAGTTLELQNTSATELHELVAFRLPDGDDVPIAELVELPPDELVPRLGAPATVVLQAPGSDQQILAVGDGSLQEPGRYVIMCFIPSGVDPQVYLDAAAASNGEPPVVDGGPPHFVNGMYAELLVEPLD
jgi:hypothetical protein